MHAAKNPKSGNGEAVLRSFIEHVVDELPDGIREVFVLRDVQRLSISEVAEALAVSEYEIRSCRARARATIRRRLVDRTAAAMPALFRFGRQRCDCVVAAVLGRITASES